MYISYLTIKLNGVSGTELRWAAKPHCCVNAKAITSHSLPAVKHQLPGRSFQCLLHFLKVPLFGGVSVGKFGNCLAAGTLPVAGVGHYILVTWPDEPSLSCAVNQTDCLFSHSPTPASIKVRGHSGCLPPVLLWFNVSTGPANVLPAAYWVSVGLFRYAPAIYIRHTTSISFGKVHAALNFTLASY